VHDAIAETLVEGIPRERVRQIHSRIARAIEARRSDRIGAIALHYDAAGEPADAYRCAQRAAFEADRVYGHATAVAFLHLAARNSTGSAELAEIRVSLARAAEAGGRHDEVEELCDLAIEWFDGQGDARRTLTLQCTRERARLEQDQPAQATLDALVALDADAQRLGLDVERVAILTLASRAHGRLGETRLAERLATESVEMAEHIGDQVLLANALTRLGNTLLAESPGRARVEHTRALELFERIGDIRGQARAHANIGIAAQFEARIDEASDAFGRAITVARAAGMADIWGAAALNLGVALQLRGEYDRARERLGEALGLFAAVKQGEYQLVALYNMAHVERELGLWESAAGLYDATTPLAQRIGHSDIEIGATAGGGLCHLELKHLELAGSALLEVRSRMEVRPEWFQGREIAEALSIRMDALRNQGDDALSRFEIALSLAEAADFYTAAWLAAECAPSLFAFDKPRVLRQIDRYAARVRQLENPEMTRRYEALFTA
jgi:tetratricopeptide (TPR) repeat protein